MHRFRRSSGDDGFILVFALVFLGIIAVVVTSVISLSTTGVRSVSVSREDLAKRYAADAALKFAVQQARTRPQACTATPSPLVPPAGFFTSNSNVFSTTGTAAPTVTVGCTLGTTTFTYGAAGFALITNSEAPDGLQITGASSVDSLPVGGPVFIASQPGGSPIDLPLNVNPGDAHGYRRPGGTCPPKPLNLTVTAPFTYSCLTTPPSPNIVLPTTTPSAMTPRGPLPAKVLGTCALLMPGFYDGTGARAIDLSVYNDVYLASGLYYFEDMDILVGQSKTFIGGWRGADGVESSGSACASDSDIPALSSVTGTGVKVILGGTSRLRADRGVIELFSRKGLTSAQQTAEGTEGVSLMTVPAGATGGWEPSCIPVGAACSPTAFVIGAASAADGSSGSDRDDCGRPVGGGQQPSFVVHGLTYAPASCVRLRSQSTETKLLGGLVAGRLDIGTSANIGGFNISVQSIRRPRRMTIVATASISGDRAVTATAELLVQHSTGAVEISRWVSPL